MSMVVFELWVPDERGVFLQRASGWYGGHEAFGEKSKGTVFGKGDGLPGRSWASKQPEIFASIKPPSHFVRGAAAEEAGLAGGLAIPVMREGEVIAVLTILTPDSDQTGLMELWSPSTDDTSLTWRFGFYGPLDEVRTTSISTRFARDEGLPGRAWTTRLPEICTAVSDSASGRADIAGPAHLTTGLSIPIMLGTGMQSIVTLLSTEAMPFARVMEIWRPSEDGQTLERIQEFYGPSDEFRDAAPGPVLTRGEGLPGQVWETGMPQLFSRQEGQAGPLSVAIGLPVIDDDRVTAVVMMLS